MLVLMMRMILVGNGADDGDDDGDGGDDEGDVF